MTLFPMPSVRQASYKTMDRNRLRHCPRKEQPLTPGLKMSAKSNIIYTLIPQAVKDKTAISIEGMIEPAFLLQAVDIILACPLVVFMGAADGAVDIPRLPAKLDKGHDPSQGIVFVIEEFNRRPDEGPVEKKGDENISRSFGVKMTRPGDQGGDYTCRLR